MRDSTPHPPFGTLYTALVNKQHLACSAGVFFERAICSRKRHVETSRREEEMGRVKGLLFLLSPIFHCHKIKDGGYNNITNTNKVFARLKYACTAG